MRRFTVEQAEANFGALIDAAQHDPIEIVRSGKAAAVVLSPQALRTILARTSAAIPRADLDRLMRESMVRHGDVYRALAEWEARNEPPDRSGR